MLIPFACIFIDQKLYAIFYNYTKSEVQKIFDLQTHCSLQKLIKKQQTELRLFTPPQQIQ